MLAHTDGNTGVHRATPERIAVILVMLIATVHVSPLVFEHVDASSTNDDWTQIFAFQAFLTDQLVSTGTLPERSHILGGGFPIVGHPEYPVLSPVALPVLALGPVLGVRFAAAAYFLLGVFGMWAWLRKTGFSPQLPPMGVSLRNQRLVYRYHGVRELSQIYYLWLPLWLWLVIPESDTAPRLDGRRCRCRPRCNCTYRWTSEHRLHVTGGWFLDLRAAGAPWSGLPSSVCSS